MAAAFQFELVSPEQLLVSREVSQVLVPGTDGYFTVLKDHAPTMSTLQPGVAEVTDSAGALDKFVIFGGFIDVTPDTCTLLAESAVRVADIDASHLDERISNAREDVADARDDETRAKAQAYLDQLTTLQKAVLSN